MEDDLIRPGTAVIFLLLLFLEMIVYGFTSAIQNRKRQEEDDLYKESDKKAARLQYIIDNPAKYTNAIQLGIVTVNMLFGALYLYRLHQYFSYVVYRLAVTNISGLQGWHIKLLAVLTGIVVTVCLLYIVLIFGVLIPRKAASRYPDMWMRLCITPIYYYTRIVAPFTAFVSITARGILQLFGIKGLDETADVTEEEILSLVNTGHEQGVLLASEAEMITNIFEYGEKEAKDIMVNRNNMIALDCSVTLSEAAAFILEEHNSRFPVYEGTIDHIVGILHLKDVMRMQMNEKMASKPIGKIKGLLREPLFITETRKIDDLLKTMQSEKIQMAIVIDEYGQTAGLLALEDILEEIVGNIQDEYDEEESYIKESGQDEYIIDGMMPLEELEEQLDISLEEDNFDTVNGFVISRLEHIPEEGEEFEFVAQGYCFRILDVKDRMIQSVMASKVPEMEDGEENTDMTVEETKEK
ncbi:MAG: hemolysin family protein [Roseburia sp.]|nr:hemolysin family protein [Ruminococcus sp.]MCM1154648.1 hemolysin family protein [Roseburia sp.]MCM1241941.1 hemolysin family protein [Roseburia sp.]